MKFKLLTILAVFLSPLILNAQTIHVESENFIAATPICAAVTGCIQTTADTAPPAIGNHKIVLRAGSVFDYALPSTAIAGKYSLTVRVDGTLTVHFEDPIGTNISGTITGTSQAWNTVGPVPVTLPGPGTLRMVVDSSGNGYPAANWFELTFIAPAIPTIASITPTSGMAGSSVTIAGMNFGASQGSSTVTFNGTPGIPSSWSATSIVVPVPVGATTGNVIVTVGTASNAIPFTVTLPPPTISISPTTAISAVPYIPPNLNFTDIVSNATDPSVTWSASCGTIDSNGVYRPPLSVPTSGSCTVTVALVSDSTVNASSIVTIIPSPTTAPPPANIVFNVTIAPSQGITTNGKTTLPGAVVGVSYSVNLVTWLAVSGGSGSYSFAVSAGSLPGGLTLTPAGILSGTPTGTGLSSFTITVN